MNYISEVIKSRAARLLGVIWYMCIIIFVVLSVPVYIFRLVVKILAKWCRHDLDDILDVQSSVLVNDYFGKNNPRSNLVLTAVFQGHVTIAEWKSLVLNNLALARDKCTGELKYKRLHQYPVRWMGFTFWAKGLDTFDIDNHVHQLYGMEQNVSHDQLTMEVEGLLNTKSKSGESPWEFFVVENYQHPNLQDHNSAIILKLHHCLSDGYGILTSFVEGLLKHGSLESLGLPEMRAPKLSTSQQLIHLATLPINMVAEFSHILSNNFRHIPLVIPDQDKEWYQVCAKADPIPLQDIKDIKNEFGVSFTSVLISAISAGVFKILEKSERHKLEASRSTSIPVLSILPVIGMNLSRELANNATAAIFDISCDKLEDPVERLLTTDRILEEARRSVVPLGFQQFTVLAGAHFYPVCKVMMKNRFIPIGVSNFPGMPLQLHLNGKLCLHNDFVVGGLDGDCGKCGAVKNGVTIAIVSHHDEINISVAAERALMTSEETKRFLKFVTDEISVLRQLVEHKGK